MSAGDQVIDSKTLLFFEKQPAALPIYECFAERLYEQNQAQAIRNAIPSPLSVLNVIQSGSWQKALVSVLFGIVDETHTFDGSDIL